tara:strand:+ start:83 stop:673 length:591 start_codon:yes stop_codon:yes gene_type:complete
MATQNVIRQEHIDFVQNYRFKAGRIGGRYGMARPRESDVINAALKFTKKCLELPDVEDLFIDNLKKEMTDSVYLITWIDEEGGRITKIGKARDPINRFWQIKDRYEKKGFKGQFNLMAFAKESEKITETILHREFKEHKWIHDFKNVEIEGKHEWFNLTGKQIYNIATKRLGGLKLYGDSYRGGGHRAQLFFQKYT